MMELMNDKYRSPGQVAETCDAAEGSRGGI